MINVSPCFDPDYPFEEVTTDRSEYYLRQGEAPGRWTGDGARALGLAGEVSPAALRALFCGKHPVTGAYLASAKGSSARAGARSAGKDLDVPAAAARLGMPADRVRALLRSGELAGEKRRSGAWRVSADAVDAYEQGRPQPSALGNLPAPTADGTYGLAEAARLAGVNRSYLARLVNYRDAAGLFDRRISAHHGAHPLGPAPADPVLAAHRDQVRAAVAAALVDIAVADVARHVPPLPDRPGTAVAELAEDPLPVLDAELASVRMAPSGGHGRQDPAVVLARARLVADAVAVRERLLAARAVASPPAWLRADVATRCAERRLDEGGAFALAAAYGRLGAHLERAGDAVDQAEIKSLVDEDLAARAAHARHQAALGRLGAGPPEPPAHGLGLAR